MVSWVPGRRKIREAGTVWWAPARGKSPWLVTFVSFCGGNAPAMANNGTALSFWNLLKGSRKLMWAESSSSVESGHRSATRVESEQSDFCIRKQLAGTSTHVWYCMSSCLILAHPTSASMVLGFCVSCWGLSPLVNSSLLPGLPLPSLPYSPLPPFPPPLPHT